MKQSELQVSRHLIRKELNELYNNKASLIEEIERFYTKAEPSTNYGQACFYALNISKDELRDVNNKIAKYSKISRSLRSAMEKEKPVEQDYNASLKYVAFMIGLVLMIPIVAFVISRVV